MSKKSSSGSLSRVGRWLMALSLCALLTPAIAKAQTDVKASGCAALSAAEQTRVAGSPTTVFVPDISIPGFTAGKQIIITANSAGDYVRGLFVGMVWIVGILAVVMVIYGGVKWVAAAGNSSLIKDAKDVVTNAIIGLVIALTSVLLLQLINPDFIGLNGITATPVSRCTLALLSSVTQGVEIIPKSFYVRPTGDPNEVCFSNPLNRDQLDPSRPCVGDLTGMVVRASEYSALDGTAVKVDPGVMKALIILEADRVNGKIVSAPTRGPQSPGSKLRGTAYGIVQMVHDAALIPYWTKVAGAESIPAYCTGQDQAQWRNLSTGSLNDACAAYLDAHLDLQLRMMARRLYDIGRSSAVSFRPTMMAAVYHLGEGNADDFFSGRLIRDESAIDTQKYLKKFNDIYNNYLVSQRTQPPVGMP